jgi:hypothetical protein
VQAECKKKQCSADPDGCQVEVPKPTFEQWAQASGDSAVNMMKKYFYGPGRISRRHMWSSEAIPAPLPPWFCGARDCYCLISC